MNPKEKTLLGLFVVSFVIILYFVLLQTGVIHVQEYGSSPRKTSYPRKIQPPLASSPSRKIPVNKQIAVHISGAVHAPGLYRVDKDARLGELIERADGLCDTADMKSINLAMKLDDGVKIVIPVRSASDGWEFSKNNGENVVTNRVFERYVSSTNQKSTLFPTSPRGKPHNRQIFSSPVHSEKININTADSLELDQLSNVGPATARRIILYRESHGPFKRIEDIRNVSRIGPKIFETLKSEITVD